MDSLFKKILILGFFFLLVISVSVKADNNFDVDFGPQVYENSEMPVILPRAIWENSADLRNLLDWYPSSTVSTDIEMINEKENKPPEYSSIDRIIIHDMGCNVDHPGCNDKKIDPISIIQNIYRYHAVTRGWGDIGYHYIIDYWGNIYEGRYGGNGVRGAHTYYNRNCDNFNVGSIGILLMGNYEKTEPSETMYKSLIRLVAWLAATNGLDPKELNHTSEVWHSPKLPRDKARNNSGCDLSQGSLAVTYTGPVVLGHRDIEYGNSDPGLVDLERVRQQAAELSLKFEDYVYTVENDSKIYFIKNGIKKELSPSKKLGSLNKIILNKNQLDIFPSLTKESYSDGSLVKSYTRNRVYLIENNKRRPIFSEKLFQLRKFDWSDIKILSDRELAKYSLSKPLTYPDNVLIKGQGPKIYLVEDGKRRHISSAVLFTKLGFNWEDVITVNQSELTAHPLGEKLLFADGTLIKEKELPPVYLVQNQKRHWIKSLAAFISLGYKWKDVISLSSEEISSYAIGSIIESAEDVLALGALGDREDKEDREEKKETEESMDEPNIRIGIYAISKGEDVKIKANKSYEVYKNDILLADKKANEIINIPYSNTDFYKLIPKNKNTVFEIISYEDRPQWNPELNDNLFRGSIEIKYSPESKQVWVINELSLEDYLKGVAEALNNDTFEYLKAFVVAARSYALFHIQNGGKRPGEIFHLKNWAYDQLYKGYGFEKRASNIAKAVEETRGVIAVFNGEPIRGVYSSDSGGITKSACQVFKGVFCNNKEYDYLKGGVKDPQGTIHSQTATIASHGVGLSSAGARRLAEMGKNFKEILKWS